MEDERMEGKALVTTKIARVERDAIIPERTCNRLHETPNMFEQSHFDQNLYLRHLVIRWKELPKKNPLKWTSASSWKLAVIVVIIHHSIQ